MSAYLIRESVHVICPLTASWPGEQLLRDALADQY